MKRNPIWKNFIEDGEEKVKYRLRPQFFCINEPPVAYLSIPKNACTAIKMAVASLKNPDLAREGAIPAAEIHWKAANHFDRTVFSENLEPDKYFRFTFVRNPYSRFFAFYRNKVLGGDQTLKKYFDVYGIAYGMNIKDCLSIMLKIPINEHNAHFAPQHAFILDHAGEMQVDFIGRMEQFSDDWEIVEQKAGQKINLLRLNASVNKFQLEYDQEVLDMICRLYEKDFQFLGYEKEHPLPEGV